MKDAKIEEAMEGIDEARRRSIRRLAVGGAFLAPVVAAFAMQGLTISPAMASNSTVSNIQ